MMMRRLYYTAFLLLIICFSLRAQDPNFSQYFASPLTLNPALTGYFDGDFRFAVNERQQWWNVGSNYSTTSISADVKILKDRIPIYDTFGIGFSALFDKSLNGALKSNYFAFSSAYHKGLSSFGSQTLTVGLQATFADRYFDLTNLTFASQFSVDYFDKRLPVNIDYSNTDTRYFEANVGILYAAHFEKVSVYAGGSLYHVNQPIQSLFNPAGDKTPMRGAIHSGGDFQVSPSSSILYSGVYMMQGNADNELIGAAYGLKTSHDLTNSNYTRLYLGMWYRVNDSFIPYVGFDYNNFSIGVNYSLAQSPIYSYRPQEFEVSLIFRSKYNVNQSNTCPRF